MNGAPEDTNRLPHASLDVASRQRKAKRIERILSLDSKAGPHRVLEIGTGSGVIANYFATHQELDCDVSAVDVVDQRVLVDAYEFKLVSDTKLPFEDDSFDVVISNHVIEHVGKRSEQIGHLSEVRRVMNIGGVGYLATPNRWTILEPHYRLPFLSWLPPSLRTPYLRIFRRESRYDCEPMSLVRLNSALEESGLAARHRELAALGTVLRFGRVVTGSLGLADRLPEWVHQLLANISPTFICLLEPDR